MSRRAWLGGAAALTLGGAAARERAPWRSGGPLSHEAYVWQRRWGDAVQRAVSGAGADVSALVVLAAEVRAGHVQRVAFDAGALRASGVPVGLAVRVFERAGGPDEGDARATIEALGWARQRLAAAGVAAGEVQIDLDCAASQLGRYRAWLQDVRAAQPGARLTITALPSWLVRPAFWSLVASVDDYVLQVHGVDAATAGQARLFDVTEARRAIDRAGVGGARFRVALPTYAYRLGFDARGRLAGVEAEDREAHWDEGWREERVASRAVDVAALIRSLEQGRPRALGGVIWYRLPVEGDRAGWSLTTLRAVQRGRAPEGRLVLATERQDDGAWSVLARNEGEDEVTLPGPVRVGWREGEQRAASDGLAGWRAEARGAHVLEFHTYGRAPVLRPGERCEIGWVRLRSEGRVEVRA